MLNLKKYTSSNTKCIASARGSVKEIKSELLTQNKNNKKSQGKLSHITKENNGIPLKQLKRVGSNLNKKLADPNKYIVRKHLAEIYAKIIFKVKDIERKKRVNLPLKSIKKILEKCPTSKGDLRKIELKKLSIHGSKKSIQYDAIS